MADTVRKVDYFKIEVANKAGEGARILGALSQSGINMLAFTGFPRGRRAQIDFIPENTVAFKKAAQKAGLKLGSKKTGFLIRGNDRVGAVADILARLGAAKVNVTAIDAITTGDNRYGAILWVKPKDLAKATRTLAKL